MKNILLLVVAFLLCGCNDFLDEQPSKSSNIIVSTVEHLDALLGNYSVFYEEGNRVALFGTDDCGVTPEVYKHTGSAFAVSEIEQLCWDKEFLPMDDREVFWGNEYTKIFYANLVLTNLENVSGEKSLKEEMRCEAHLIRAYSNFQLVNTYALPYTEKTRNEPGITLKMSNNFEESVVRATIEKVYAAIEADIAEALKAPNSVVKDGVYRPWRGNSAAAKAFAARFYLFRENYKLAEQYAEQALTEYNTLVDYNTEMEYYGTIYEVQENPDVENSPIIQVRMPKTWDSRNAIHWKEFYYTRFLYNGGGWNVPSENLLQLYDESADLRYKYHVVEAYSKYMSDNYPSYPGYIFWGQYDVPSGPTVAEMILTKAECQARLGNYSDAMNTVNILRVKRMSNEMAVDVINLSAGSQEEAIRKILEERRREMPFAMRWFDLRRLNNNADPSDDKTLERLFYPYTSTAVQWQEQPIVYKLSFDSRRWAAPVPYTEIETSNGIIEQNMY